MSSIRYTPDNFDRLSKYLYAVEQINHHPLDEGWALALKEADEEFSETFMAMPTKDSEGQRYFIPVLTTGAIEEVRHHPSLREIGAVANHSRRAITHVGSRIAISGALESDRFPVAYDLLEHTLQRIGSSQKATDGVLGDIRKKLWGHYVASRKGQRRSVLEPDKLEANVKEALNYIGYPLGILGRLSMSSLSETILSRRDDKKS